MSRYVDTDVAIDKVDCLFRDTERDKGNFMLIGYNHAVADCIAILKNLDAVEVKHGHWEREIIKDNCGCNHCYYCCSKCGKASDDEFDYCPNCGAKMDEVTQ